MAKFTTITEGMRILIDTDDVYAAVEMPSGKTALSMKYDRASVEIDMIFDAYKALATQPA